MELLNIQNGGTVQQLHYEYDSDSRVYSFEKDIVIGDWTISRLIQRRGPKVSTYKYDFKNFLEFIVTDGNGETQLLTWHYNSGDEALGSYYWVSTHAEALSHFFAEHPIFSAKDWKDYKSVLALKKISEILNQKDKSASDKVEIISKAIEDTFK